MEEILEQEKLQQNEETAENVEEALQEEAIGDPGGCQLYSTGYIQLTMKGGALFDSGSAELKEESREVLSKVGRVLEQYSGGTVEIEGHTDNVPITTARYASNEELSSARALSVFYYLKDNTYLNPSRLEACRHGRKSTGGR